MVPPLTSRSVRSRDAPNQITARPPRGDGRSASFACRSISTLRGSMLVPCSRRRPTGPTATGRAVGGRSRKLGRILDPLADKLLDLRRVRLPGGPDVPPRTWRPGWRSSCWDAGVAGHDACGASWSKAAGGDFSAVWIGKCEDGRAGASRPLLSSLASWRIWRTTCLRPQHGCSFARRRRVAVWVSARFSPILVGGGPTPAFAALRFALPTPTARASSAWTCPRRSTALQPSGCWR